jgi:hypothetical protein
MYRARSLAIGILLSGCVSCCAETASARVVTCSFIEPFVRTTYNSDRQTLVLAYDVDKRRETKKEISFHTVSAKIFELRNADNEVVQHLELNFRGSDGMSDRVFPLSVEWMPRDPMLPDKLYGGCVSDSGRKPVH